MDNSTKIGVIGGGSWGTAIVKMLSENIDSINWWIRNDNIINGIRTYHHNPNYLSDAKLNPSKLNLTSNLDKCISESDFLILSVPSAFLKTTLDLSSVCIKKKVVFSSIKGIVPENNSIVGDYIYNSFGVPYENIGVITGPCHAEEVALERLSYLTIACMDVKKSMFFSDLVKSRYIKTIVSDDIYGTEYSAVLKNVIAIAAGICHAIGYGDNFQAVLISNAVREINRFVNQVHPISRDINESAYLGDLLVTCYSQFSRNRTFGEMIGRGYSVKSAQLELNMIAEGYYAVKCVYEINKRLNIEMPISNAIYEILYENRSAVNQIKILSEKLI